MTTALPKPRSHPDRLAIQRRLQAMVAPKIGVEGAEVPLDQPLMSELGLDSMDVVELLTEVEEAFAPATLRAGDAESITTLRELATYLERELLASRPGAVAGLARTDREG